MKLVKGIHSLLSFYVSNFVLNSGNYINCSSKLKHSSGTPSISTDANEFKRAGIRSNSFGTSSSSSYKFRHHISTIEVEAASPRKSNRQNSGDDSFSDETLALDNLNKKYHILEILDPVNSVIGDYSGLFPDEEKKEKGLDKKKKKKKSSSSKSRSKKCSSSSSSSSSEEEEKEIAIVKKQRPRGSSHGYLSEKDKRILDKNII